MNCKIVGAICQGNFAQAQRVLTSFERKKLIVLKKNENIVTLTKGRTIIFLEGWGGEGNEKNSPLQTIFLKITVLLSLVQIILWPHTLLVNYSLSFLYASLIFSLLQKFFRFQRTCNGSQGLLE